MLTLDDALTPPIAFSTSIPGGTVSHSHMYLDSPPRVICNVCGPCLHLIACVLGMVFAVNAPQDGGSTFENFQKKALEFDEEGPSPLCGLRQPILRPIPMTSTMTSTATYSSETQLPAPSPKELITASSSASIVPLSSALRSSLPNPKIPSYVKPVFEKVSGVDING